MDLKREGRTLPTPPPVVATLAMTVRAGSLLFVSGHGPFVDGKLPVRETAGLVS